MHSRRCCNYRHLSYPFKFVTTVFARSLLLVFAAATTWGRVVFALLSFLSGLPVVVFALRFLLLFLASSVRGYRGRRIIHISRPWNTRLPQWQAMLLSTAFYGWDENNWFLLQFKKQVRNNQNRVGIHSLDLRDMTRVSLCNKSDLTDNKPIPRTLKLLLMYKLWNSRDTDLLNQMFSPCLDYIWRLL